MIDRRNRHSSGTAARRRRPAPSAGLGGLQKKVSQTLVRTGIARWAPRVIGGVACCGLLWVVIVLAPRPTRLHGVEGSVRINDKPLRNGVLEFQRKGPPSQDKRFWTAMQTDANGTFRRDAAVGLPEGRYAVAVRVRRLPAAGTAPPQPVTIPAPYTTLVSTPLSIEIDGSNTALDLVIQ